MRTSTNTTLAAIAVVVGTLIPGGGHLLYGRRGKGAFYFVSILLLFGVGLWLGEGLVVNRERFPLYLIAQIWTGLPTLITLFATKGMHVTHDIPYLDAGLLFTASAGLLNVVAAVDVYETHRRILEGDRYVADRSQATGGAS